MTKLQYAQEYLAQFLDELKKIYSKEWIEKVCTLKRVDQINPGGSYYLGSDIAGWGEDLSTYEIFEKFSENRIEQVENIVERHNLTTETSRKIIALERRYDFVAIGIDDGGLGFGVFSELMSCDETKRKTKPVNNASREVDHEGEKSKKLLKEEMHINLQVQGEVGNLKLLDDDEIKASLRSMQHDTEVRQGEKSKTKIFGSDAHIAEGIARGVWLASKDKTLNIWIY